VKPGKEKTSVEKRPPPKPSRERYLPPRVTFIEISAREALMAVCKGGGPVCMATKGPGS